MKLTKEEKEKYCKCPCHDGDFPEDCESLCDTCYKTKMNKEVKDINKAIVSTIARTLGFFAVYYFSGIEAAGGYLYGLIIFTISK